MRILGRGAMAGISFAVGMTPAPTSPAGRRAQAWRRGPGRRKRRAGPMIVLSGWSRYRCQGRNFIVMPMRPQFPSDIVTRKIGIASGARRPDGHIARRFRSPPLDVANPATFLVGGEEKGDRGPSPQSLFLECRDRVGQSRRVLGIPAENLDAAYAPGIHPAQEGGRWAGTSVANHENLGKQFLIFQGRHVGSGDGRRPVFLKKGGIRRKVGLAPEIAERGPLPEPPRRDG